MTSEKRQLLYEIKQTNQTLSLNYLIKVSVPVLKDILEKERKKWGR
jgi:hypothetical protein